MNPAVLGRVASELELDSEVVERIVQLFEEGATVPFIARYRRDAAGGLDEFRLRDIEDLLASYRDLEERRAGVLALLDKQGKLTPSLREQVEGTFARSELEDLALLHRPRRRPLSDAEKNLEPLVEYILNQEPDAWGFEEHINVCVDPEKCLATPEAVLEG